jgi:alkane 1-monooxygenase
MSIKAVKYFLPITFYLLAYVSFTQTGWVAWLTILYAFLLIPVAELLLQPNEQNMQKAEEEVVKKDKLYDYMLYLFVALQFVALYFFFNSIKANQSNTSTIIARIATMGLLCGVFGINVAHELGHRNNVFEQFLAKAALLTSLYIHFFIEHNKGHHKNVATPADPSSARLNEPVYTFYYRTIVYSYLSAWHIANDEMRKKNKAIFGLANEMVQAHLIQIAFVVAIYYFFGTIVMCYFLVAALIGILLLETVNYIEHYGLQRKETAPGKFERALPIHSWNSSHIIGRIMLFELSRHSDHHYLASRKYQILQHHSTAPQLPTGYPGSMILAMVPPLWFYVMNKKIKQLQA